MGSHDRGKGSRRPKEAIEDVEAADTATQAWTSRLPAPEVVEALAQGGKSGRRGCWARGKLDWFGARLIANLPPWEHHRSADAFQTCSHTMLLRCSMDCLHQDVSNGSGAAKGLLLKLGPWVYQRKSKGCIIVVNTYPPIAKGKSENVLLQQC